MRRMMRRMRRMRRARRGWRRGCWRLMWSAQSWQPAPTVTPPPPAMQRNYPPLSWAICTLHRKSKSEVQVHTIYLTLSHIHPDAAAAADVHWTLFRSQIQVHNSLSTRTVMVGCTVTLVHTANVHIRLTASKCTVCTVQCTVDSVEQYVVAGVETLDVPTAAATSLQCIHQYPSHHHNQPGHHPQHRGQDDDIFIFQRQHEKYHKLEDELFYPSRTRPAFGRLFQLFSSEFSIFTHFHSLSSTFIHIHPLSPISSFFIH